MTDSHWRTLRVATYNIHRSRGLDGRTNPERIAEVIRAIDADVVALQEVRSILAGAGVPPEAVALRPNRASDPRKLATMRLHYPKVLAEAGPCGLWPYDLGPALDREHFENREYYNFGCAYQRNLAAMVDSPTDLVQPRGEVPSYTARRTTVLEKYRKGESTATTYPDAGKGKISDLGQ